MTSGALAWLVAQGVQNTYTTGTMDSSLFRQRFSRCSNFSQSPSQLGIVGKIAPGSRSVISIPKKGDLINYLWIDTASAHSALQGTVFELWVGSQMIDSQTVDYVTDIWQVYLAETKSKSSGINNFVSTSDTSFFPFHFYFCDNSQFFPLISVPFAEVEIRVRWGPSVSADPKVYGNFIYLDTAEREYFASGEQRDFMITQVQKLEFNNPDGDMNLDLSSLNHPVKALFWGQETKSDEMEDDYFTFDGARIMLNGQDLLSYMDASYFHTVQAYYHTTNAIINFVNALKCPFYTRYYMYSYAMDASAMSSTGSCNFSRLDNATLQLKNAQRPPARQSDTLNVYALSWNVLRFQSGLAGILFSN